MTRGAAARLGAVGRADDRSFEPGVVDERTFFRVLDEVVATFEDARLPYAFLGGVASAALGRPRWTRDLDIFIRPEHAPRALELLAARGFDTQRTNENWLFKGMKDGVLVDLLFRAKGDIYLDEEMQRRLVRTSFRDHPLVTVPPEDLLVIKAIVHDEETPRHWYDALGVIASQELDWDYLMWRASAGMRRVLSLLVYAQSTDIVVPDSVIASMVRTAYRP